ncbi:MAG: choice-of-anchor Q domain-containing protein, partial [Luteolibacter sp.]
MKLASAVSPPRPNCSWNSPRCSGIDSPRRFVSLWFSIGLAFTAIPAHAEVYIPDATLSLTGAVTLVETNQRIAFNANPNGGTPQTSGRTNLALPSNGGSAFESSRINATYGDDKLNNGVYGVGFPDIGDATRPWISLDSDAGGWGGVKFSTPTTLVRIGFGSRFDGRSDGSFTMEYTTANFTGIDLESPSEVNALGWVSIGTLTSTTTTEFGRHLFELNAPVVGVTGVRIVASQGGSTITEIEAYTFHVTTLADSGAGSLRQALADASPGDIIGFDPILAGGTITLEGSQLSIDETLTIDVSNLAAPVTIDGNGMSRVFRITPGHVVTLRNLILTGGNGKFSATGINVEEDDKGGVIHNNQSDLTLDSCTFLGNSSNFAGGAIYNNGSTGSASLTLVSCTLSGNYAQQYGGAIYNDHGTLDLDSCTLSENSANLEGGAIYNDGDGGGNASLTLESCTLSGNSAPNYGGAIYNYGIGGNATAVLDSCTLSGNSAAIGGGIYNLGISGTASLSLKHSIVAGNASTSSSPDISNDSGTVSSIGKNLLGDASGSGLTAGPTVLVNPNPKLAPLGYYGGPTQTIHPLFGSPAIDAVLGSTPPPATDARGFPRLVGSHRALGAVETGNVITVTNAGDSATTTMTLRKALADATSPGTIIRFNSSTFNGQLADVILNSTELGVLSGRAIFIDASNIYGGVTLDSGGTNGLFSVSPQATLAVHSLTLKGGGGAFGGAIINQGELTVANSTLSGNSAGADGGGIYNLSGAALAVNGSTISGNTANGYGGGIYNYPDATLSIVNSTLSGNAADSGGGIYNDAGTIRLTNSIVAANHAPTVPNGPDLFNNGGTVTSRGKNLLGDETSSGLTAGATLLVADPKLAPLGYYGGPTQTMIPLAGSPAINAASGSATSTIDQRGFPRSVGSAMDIGAVELGPIVTVNDTGDGAGTATTLRNALAAATAPGAVIRFDPGVFNGKPADTITLSNGRLDLFSSVTIDASNIVGGVTIDAHDQSDIFTVFDELSVSMHRLTLTGGRSTGAGGGAIWSRDANLTLDSCTLSGNSTTGSAIGGAIYSFSDDGVSNSVLHSCTLSANSAFFGGAIGLDSAGGRSAMLSLHSCTLSGNSSLNYGGAIHSDGSSAGSTVLILSACTLTGNSAGNYGGAIYNDGMSLGNASLTLSSCTLSGNSAPFNGGGIYNRDQTPGSSGSAVVILRDSIVAANSVGSTGSGPDIFQYPGSSGTISALGINLLGDTTASTLAAGPTVIVNPDPKLSPPGYFGGLTQTLHPLAGSPAIDPSAAAATSRFPTDARGFARVVGGKLDIGAVESGAVTLVDNNGDGAGTSTTLRKAITDATAPGAVIRFSSNLAGQPIRLSSELVIPGTRDGLFIDASNLSGGVILDAGETSRVLAVNAGARAVLHGLTLTRGQTAGNGGAILNFRANLTLSACTLSGNSAGTGGGGIYNDSDAGIANLNLHACTLSGNSATSGGGIYSNGYSSGTATLALDSCTIDGNSASSSGGGIYSNGTSSGSGLLTLDSCTLTGNSALSNGGAIFSDGETGKAIVTLDACTITGNSAASGGGIYSTEALSGNALFTFKNSIIAANSLTGAGSGPDIRSINSTLSALGKNLLSSISGSSLSTSDPALIIAADPMLAPLGNYGGPTYTMIPLLGSPVIDAGSNFNPGGTDQRGFPRFEDGDKNFTFLLDIGAVESGPITLVNTAEDEVGPNGKTSLREAITFANAASPGAAIEFDPSFFDGQPTDEMALTLGQLTLSNSVIIHAANIPGGVTIDAGGNSRVLEITPGSAVTLKNLTLTGGAASGSAPSNHGGGIYAVDATLSLEDVKVTNNSATSVGGGIHVVDCDLSLNRCLISGNQNGFQCGGLFQNGGTSTLLKSTFTGNTTPFNGAAVYITNSAICNVNHCTISGNSSTSGTGGGGGFMTFASARLHLVHTTVANNSANLGGGIQQGQANVIVTLRNSIVAGNTAATGPDINGSISTHTGVNFIGNTTGTSGLGTQGTDYLTGDPMLASLGNYGGPTPTMPPFPISPAIDAAGTTAPGSTDQRGFPRLVNGALDIGAVESGPSTLVDTAEDEVSANGKTSLREAIDIANATSPEAIIHFDPAVFDGQPADKIDLSSGQLTIATSQIIFASNIPGGVTIDAGGNSRIFRMNPDNIISLVGLTLTGGQVASGDGGAIYNDHANLNLYSCDISDNAAPNGSG